ncbi:MAG TPA: His/Gly/Thr/Pro-type tRNA ligase C-terminal domain-containing protein, partial [Desulfomonilia bacterium]|nr:His/Gly/Thr/Pro-type tRNA ligase C-terminal domain-containing protein [Desulfomonilia bacterium]
YTRTTFEITAAGLGSQNAVAGGGRYDDLLSVLGGPQVGGIGFAFGMERMIMLMGEARHRETGCFVVTQPRPDIELASLALISELRSAGIRTEASPGRSFKAQMRRADRSGYPLCAILGEDEVKTATLTIRDMRTASQIKINRAAVLEEVTSLLADRKGE